MDGQTHASEVPAPDPRAVGVYSVTAFGADPTGVRDSHAALMDAIRAAQGRGGGSVVLPPGSTIFASDLVGSRTNTDWLHGVRLHAYGATLVSGLGARDRRQAIKLLGDDVAILGLTLLYATPPDVRRDREADVDGEAIRIGGGFGPANTRSRALVRDCRILGAWNAGILPYNAEHVRVLDNYVTGCVGDGIFPGDCRRDVVIRGNVVHGTGDDAIFVENGRETAYACRDVRIVENRCYDCHTRAIGVAGVRGALIAGNVIEGTWVAGIQPEWTEANTRDPTGDLVIDGNVIRGAGTHFGAGRKNASPSPVPHGIYLATGPTRMVRGLRISRNEIDGARGAGVLVGWVDGCEIVGNAIRRVGGLGISAGVAAARHRRSMLRLAVEDNRLEDVGETGIIVTHATGGVVRGNEINGYGARGRAVDFPYQVYECDDVVGRDNRGVNSKGAEFSEAGLARSRASTVGAGDRFVVR